MGKRCAETLRHKRSVQVESKIAQFRLYFMMRFYFEMDGQFKNCLANFFRGAISRPMENALNVFK
jgi:hypothetical protein